MVPYSGGFPKAEFDAYGSHDQRAAWLSTVTEELDEFQAQRADLTAKRDAAESDVVDLEEQLKHFDDKKATLLAKQVRITKEIGDADRQCSLQARRLKAVTREVAFADVAPSTSSMDVDDDEPASQGNG